MRKVMGCILGSLFVFCAVHDESKEWDNPLDPNGIDYYPPTVTAMDDRAISINDTIQITAQGSDKNGTIEKYLWALDGVNFDNTTSDNFINAAFPNSGVMSVSVKVIDNDGLVSDADTTTITVTLDAPLITPVNDTIVSQRDTVTIHVTAIDTNSNGTIEKYYWDKNADGWDDSTDAAQYYFSQPEGGGFTVVWGARDDDHNISTDTFTLRFNRVPSSVFMVKPSNGGTASWVDFNQSVCNGSVELHFSGNDPDGSVDTLTYTLCLNKEAVNLEEVFCGNDTLCTVSKIDTCATYHWRLHARDLYGDSVVQTGTFVTQSTPPPPKLSVNTESLQFGATTEMLNFRITNTGGCMLNWSTTTITNSGGGWIKSVSPSQGNTAANTNEYVTVSVDRSGFLNGDYSGEVRISSNGGSATVFITMSVQSTFYLRFRNKVFTDIAITVVGQGSYTIGLQDSITINYPSNPGSFTYSAETSGKTTSGTQVGEKIVWNFTHDVSGLSSKTYNLVVNEDFFFIYIRNGGTVDLNPFHVNYGTSNETVDNIVIPPDSVKYRTGYYKAFTDTEVRAYWDNTTLYTYWIQGTHFTLPFTQSQSVSLLSTSGEMGGVKTSDRNVNIHSRNCEFLVPAKTAIPYFKNDKNAENDVGRGVE